LGRKCYIKRDDDNLGKFDSKTDEGIFRGYSSTKNSYKCYNLRLHNIVESGNVKMDDLKTKGTKSQVNPQINERIRDVDDEESIDIQDKDSQREEEKEEEESQENIEEGSPRQDTKSPSRRVQRNHPESQII
jgi:hypothetical protein